MIDCKKILKGFLSILAIIVLLLFLYVRVLCNGFCFGYRFSFVATGSMEPGIKTYSLLLEKEYDVSEKLKVGDIITFRAIGYDYRITHRIIDMDGGYLITKGDANQERDPFEVTNENVEGIVKGSFPYPIQLVAILFVIVLNVEFLIKRKKKEVVNVECL